VNQNGLNLSLAEFEKLAAPGQVIPVIKTLFNGGETPLAAYEKLTKGTHSFLLESAENGIWSRYSFVGVESRGVLLQQSDQATWISNSNALPDGSALPSHALAALEIMQQSWHSAEIAELPPLVSGMVGALGWELIREIEKLPPQKPADFESPTMCMAQVSELVIFDHETSELLLVANSYVEENFDSGQLYAAAIRSIEGLQSSLSEKSQAFLSERVSFLDKGATNRVEKSEFIDSVLAAKEFVRIGDAFQVVISQRFDIETNAAPIDIYRALRALNPSPYMYLFNFEDEHGQFAFVGSSPEALVKIQSGIATMHPIAGSRPRSANAEIDARNATELLADPKERAEHLMLVDLARNDLLKVCEAKSVAVTEFMAIERFSHIMHIVSTVEGVVSKDCSTVDVFKATFPAGTLSGAPKPRALEIITELEPSSRGLYGGVVGYFDFAGNADLAIAIRSAFVRDGVARVQSGAGVVLDSNPESEHAETISKAASALRAINMANSLKSIR
jgi:anthranilate synthase component 1